MPLVVFWGLLREYSSSSKVRTVCLYSKRTGIFGKSKDWCRSDLFLEKSKGGLFVGTPLPNCVFLGKIKERSGMVGEILNEPLVEVSEPKERLHFLLVGRNGPFGNSSDFDRIHADGVVRYDNSKILYLRAFKLAFLWFKEQVVNVE